MNLLPKTHQEFSQKEYWDSFFKKRGTKAFEWYGEYPELSEHLHKYVKQKDDILITGCGNSTLGRDLYDIGHKKVTNIDISQVVIRQMLSQNEKERPDLQYKQMDALAMTFENESFTVVLDKGTLDALMPDQTNETVEKIKKYFSEIQRVLKPAGRYICVSLLQEHILKTLLDYFPCNNWMFRVVRCHEAENKAIENGENALPVFLVICTKFKSLPRQILEVNLGTDDRMQRFETVEEVYEQVQNAQNAAFVCSNIRKTKIEGDEVSFDLLRVGDLKARFTVYVVDIEQDAKNMQYAAFIVPQGREAEWLFSTKSGHQHLAKVTKTNRLAIVTMHRGHTFGSFADVQKELDEAICNLAPANLKNKKIPYLSLGSDVGKRIIKFEGFSNFSGPYVIEDVEIDNEKFRRLYYLNSQLVIQSEAKLKTIKTKKGIKEVVDLTHLTCRHHVYMSIATQLACKKQNSHVVVVGLGGGGLCSFLCKFLPKIKITAIDIDEQMLKAATDWFGLNLSDKLKVVIEDGVQCLSKLTTEGEVADAVLFDVDSKDTTIGMSCPPKQFLEEETLNSVSKVISDGGFFILNLVLRQADLRQPIVEILQKKFKTVVSYKLAEDLNEIFICANSEIDHGDLEKRIEKSGLEINNFFKKNNSSTNTVEINDLLENLKIL